MENKPIRVQRKRVKDWTMPVNSLSVTRPGKFGNPFVVVFQHRSWWVMEGKSYVKECSTKRAAQAWAVTLFRAMMLNINAYKVDTETYARFRYMRDRIRDLQGKNLACFCSLADHCHADVLLELANPEPAALLM